MARHECPDGWIDVVDDGSTVPNAKVREVRLALAGVSTETLEAVEPRRHAHPVSFTPDGDVDLSACTEACETLADAQRRQASISPDQLASLWNLNEYVAVAAVVGWEWTLPGNAGPTAPPVSIEALRDLPERDYRAIIEGTRGLYAQMVTDFSVTPTRDPATGEPLATPTPPSNA